MQVLLAAYKPDWKYFEKQLASLNAQTVSGMEVLVHDDGALTNPIDQKKVKKLLKDKTVRFLPATEQLGVTKAFERLINESDGDYLAFCDQDDIWLPDKLEKSIKQLDEYDLACTDQSIIDGNGSQIVSSMWRTSDDPAYSWHSGDDITVQNLVRTYCVGMAMTGKGDFIRECMPIPEGSSHDQWVLACAARNQMVALIEEPLVKYRRYGNNVSRTLKGIHTKDDYRAQRIKPACDTIDAFIERFPDYENNAILVEIADARRHGRISALWKYRHLGGLFLFEIGFRLCPEILFPAMIKTAQKNGRYRNVEAAQK